MFPTTRYGRFKSFPSLEGHSIVHRTPSPSPLPSRERVFPSMQKVDNDTLLSFSFSLSSSSSDSIGNHAFLFPWIIRPSPAPTIKGGIHLKGHVSLWFFPRARSLRVPLKAGRGNFALETQIASSLTPTAWLLAMKSNKRGI